MVYKKTLTGVERCSDVSGDHIPLRETGREVKITQYDLDKVLDQKGVTIHLNISPA